MSIVYRYLFTILWVSWGLCWWALSFNVKANARRESLRSRVLHIGPLVLAILLLWFPGVPLAILGERVLPLAKWPFWAGAALTAAGLLFTLWARRHLGGNWSGTVTIKQGHELITSGPYSLVRHPIYTGLLLAFVGSAMARGDWRGVLAVAIAGWALWHKLRLEENWMREQFGEAYETYCRRVAVLAPFVL